MDSNPYFCLAIFWGPQSDCWGDLTPGYHHMVNTEIWDMNRATLLHLVVNTSKTSPWSPRSLTTEEGGRRWHLVLLGLVYYSRTLAWKIPWMEEPGRLQSMRLLRVGHDWETLLSLFTFMHWRRKWQPTPVFLPGESQGRGSLVGCRLWGRTESDTTETT